MKNRFGYVLAGLLACAIPASGGARSWEVSGYDAGSGPSLADYEASQKALLDGLVMDFEHVTPATTLRFELTAEDRAKLADKECKTCKAAGPTAYRVGVNGDVTHFVDFSGVASSISAKPVEVAGGVLRALPSGELVWTIGLESPEASGLRVAFDGFNMAAGATVTLYNWDGEAYGPYAALGPNGDGYFWSHSIAGKEAFLELRAPNIAALRASSMTISEIAHLDATLFPGTDKACAGITEPCMLDANCFGPNDFAPIANARRAMGQMLFSVGGGQAVCSGGLIADASQSRTPFFLTANHCLSTQQVASSLQVTWRFQTSACDAACPSRNEARFPKSLGSTLLATGPTPQSTDFTLLRLNGAVPADSFFLGWTRNNVQNQRGLQLFRLSHPAGAPLKYTRHVVTPDQFCDSFAPNSRYVYTVPDVGSAEGGSSGSPILNAAGLVVGQLLGVCGLGIDNPCTEVNQFRIVDGAFRVTYERIKDFIDPPPPIDIPFASEYYLAEGVTGSAFDTFVLVTNPNSNPISIEMNLLTQSSPNQVLRFDIPQNRRLTVKLDDYVENDGVSVSIREVAGRPFVAERAVYALDANGNWVGAHTSVGTVTPSRIWYFPEGSTAAAAGEGSEFETYFLVANPNSEALPLTFTFFLEDGTSFSHQFTAPALRRLTVAANPGLDARLANASFFTQVTSNGPSFYAERAMWWRAPSTGFGGLVEGNNSQGLTQLSTTWYFAEGNTLPGVDQFVLLANPSAQPAEVTLEYLRQAAQPILRTVTLAPNSRRTINVRFDEDGGFGGQFGTTRHGLAITATQPIAAERSMYIANSAGTWIAGHNTVGAPTLANVWALPEGASFGFLRTDVLVANPTNSTIAIQVIYLLESGSEVRRNYNIAPKQRITLHGSDEVAVRDRAYSTVILSKTGNFVAERSSYFNALGAEIGGATCSLGIALQLDLSTKEAEEAALEILRPIGAPESVLERRAIPTPTVTPRPTPTPRVP